MSFSTGGLFLAESVEFARLHQEGEPWSETRIRLEKPRKNRPSRSRPLPLDIFNRAIIEGACDGSLVALLLPVVGLLTARRIGLFTFLNRDWLEKVEGHYIVRPTESVVLPGRTARTPIKTDESMVP